MEANELMIGDWVGYLPTWKNEDGSIDRDGDPNNPIPFKVEMVCWDYVDLDDREGGSFDADDISLYPIPLTREILEKNGFEELMNESEVSAARFGRKPEPTGVWQYGFGRFDSVAYVPEQSFLRIKFMEGCQADIANIKYVHELQHALRLCGIEKEINL